MFWEHLNQSQCCREGCRVGLQRKHHTVQEVCWWTFIFRHLTKIKFCSLVSWLRCCSSPIPITYILWEVYPIKVELWNGELTRLTVNILNLFVPAKPWILQYINQLTMHVHVDVKHAVQYLEIVFTHMFIHHIKGYLLRRASSLSTCQRISWHYIMFEKMFYQYT